MLSLPAGARPGAGEVDAISTIVAERLLRIDEGALGDGSLEALARDLGVTSRHLRRAVHAELGISPIELAQSRRLALAKQLLHDTPLSMTEIALSSGFGSIRRFNAASFSPAALCSSRWPRWTTKPFVLTSFPPRPRPMRIRL